MSRWAPVCGGWSSATPGARPIHKRRTAMHIRNPVEWGVDQIRSAGSAIEALGHHRHAQHAPAVRSIAVDDLRAALSRGVDDFAAFRTDVAFLCVIYPIVGL